MGCHDVVIAQNDKSMLELPINIRAAVLCIDILS
jgi:hypothetical protein